LKIKQLHHSYEQSGKLLCSPDQHQSHRNSSQDSYHKHRKHP